MATTSIHTPENIDEERNDFVMQSPSDSGITSLGRNTESSSWTEDDLTDGGLTSENDEHLNKTEFEMDGRHHQTIYSKHSESMVIDSERLQKLHNLGKNSTSQLDDTDECFSRKFNEEFGNQKICDEVVLNSQRAHIIDAQFVDTDPEVSLDGLDEETIVDKAVSAGLVEPTDSRPCRTANDNVPENLLNTDGTAFNPDDMVNTEYKRGNSDKSLAAGAVGATSKITPSEPETGLPSALVTKTYQNKKKIRTVSKSSSTSSSISNTFEICDAFSTVIKPPTVTLMTGVLATNSSPGSETGIKSANSDESSSGGNVVFSMPPIQKPFPLGQISGKKVHRSRSNSPAVHYSTQMPPNAISNIINDWTKSIDFGDADIRPSDHQQKVTKSIIKRRSTASPSVLMLDESSRRSFDRNSVKSDYGEGHTAVPTTLVSAALKDEENNLFGNKDINMNADDDDDEEEDSMIEMRYTYLDDRNLHNRTRAFAPKRHLVETQKITTVTAPPFVPGTIFFMCVY